MSSASGSHPQSAVFLSYAHEDAATARRLAETLRAAGIEVWFDENELRGGEAWDRAIRKQIRDCALFVPVISANTQARLEGYFRLEWKLAEDRSHLMAKGKPFIVPVSIDDTSERDAQVPDAFLAVQWTRFSGSESPPGFVERLKRLLSGEAVPSGSRPSGSGAKAPMLPSEPRIPDYELVRQIGHGSYGDVWLARGVTGIWRAVKIVWRARFANAEPFEREFRGLKEFAEMSLGESIQMALLHVGRNDAAGFFYYVMELADDAERGRMIDPVSYVPLTLAEMRARRGRIAAGECVSFGVELARVLAGLHRRGLVHRDIKPSNVILVSGVPKLADIGLVAPATDALTFVGTDGYVPPEGPGSPGADVFALGKVLYELSTGNDRQSFPKLPTDLSGLPDRRALLGLNEIVLRACEANPAQRYRDGAALLANLEKLRAGRPVRRFGLGQMAALAAAAVALGASVYFVTRPTDRVTGSPPPVSSPPAPTPVAKLQPRGIAVLPFENLDAPDQAYFAVGFTEEITQQLSKVSALRVMSRQAVARFRGGVAELPAMTRELNIGALLTGSVRRAGNLVRINVQLLAAPSGETLWSEQYNAENHEQKDIFSVQSDVAVRVVHALRTSLAPEELARIQRLPTENAAAYELYLKARSKLTAESIPVVEQAIALDPKFTAAYCILSRLYLGRSGTTGREDLIRAEEIARKAVSLDPQLARAHWALANARASLGRIDEARLAMQRAIELDASFVTAFHDFSALEANSGRLDQSFYWAKRAFPFEPNIAVSYYHVAGPLMMLDEAAGERWLRAGIARFPANDPTGVYRLQILLACLEFDHGQTASALERMRKEAAARPKNPEVRSARNELAVYTGAADAPGFIDEAMKEGPDARSAYLAYQQRTLRAFLWLQAGDREAALPLIEAALAENRTAIEGGDRGAWLLHENASLLLLRGDRAAALEALESAADAGYRESALMKVNPILAPLAGEPRFKAVIERIERELREMRSRIDLSDLEALSGVGAPVPKAAAPPPAP